MSSIERAERSRGVDERGAVWKRFVGREVFYFLPKGERIKKRRGGVLYKNRKEVIKE